MWGRFSRCRWFKLAVTATPCSGKDAAAAAASFTPSMSGSEVPWGWGKEMVLVCWLSCNFWIVAFHISLSSFFLLFSVYQGNLELGFGQKFCISSSSASKGLRLLTLPSIADFQLGSTLFSLMLPDGFQSRSQESRIKKLNCVAPKRHTSHGYDIEIAVELWYDTYTVYPYVYTYKAIDTYTFIVWWYMLLHDYTTHADMMIWWWYDWYDDMMMWWSDDTSWCITTIWSWYDGSMTMTWWYIVVYNDSMLIMWWFYDDGMMIMM